SATVQEQDVRLEIAAGTHEAEVLSADHVLVAVGAMPNIEGLGLEHTRVATTGHGIQADAWGRTADPRIFAVGDVTGAPMLAHRAIHQALACVDHIAAGARASAPLPAAPLIPACTFGHPQTASIGLTES